MDNNSVARRTHGMLPAPGTEQWKAERRRRARKAHSRAVAGAAFVVDTGLLTGVGLTITAWPVWGIVLLSMVVAACLLPVVFLAEYAYNYWHAVPMEMLEERTQVAEGERDEYSATLAEIEGGGIPKISVSLDEAGGVGWPGTTYTRTYVLSVRNEGRRGVFYASMDVSGDYYTLRGNHRLCWTRAGGMESEITRNGEDYLHLATCDLTGDGGPGSMFTIHLHHFDPLMGNKGSKETFALLGFLVPDGIEQCGKATVTISTDPRASNGEWIGDIHFTPRGMKLGEPLAPYPKPSGPPS